MNRGKSRLTNARVLMHICLFFALAIAIVPFVGAAAAFADDLPNPTIFAVAGLVPPPEFISTNGTIGGSFSQYGTSGSITATVDYSSAGVASFSTSGTIQGGGTLDEGSGASGGVTFAFEVSGPAGVPVSVDATAFGTAEASGAAGANSTFNVRSGPDDALLVNWVACADPSDPSSCSSYPNAFGGSEEITVMSDEVNYVIIGGEALSPISGPAGTWSTSVDPMISFDPSFAQASEFTLEFSPAVGGTGGTGGGNVPEPGTLGLLCSGLLGLAGAMRTKKRIAVF